MNMEPLRERILHFVLEQVGYFKDLQFHVETLMTEAEVLKSKRRSMEGEASTKRQKRAKATEIWLNEAAKIEIETESIKSEFDQGITGYKSKLGKRILQLISDVKVLNLKPTFDPIILSSPKGSSEETLDEIWDSLHDDGIGVIGVVGMGGIGKTTIMKNINKRLNHTNNNLIWITVSKSLDLERIQNKIMSGLGLEFHHDDDDNEARSMRLYGSLLGKRYVIILDDVWEVIRLDQVGIPKPSQAQNKSKILITTRSLGVCNAMEVDAVIKVKTLTGVEAWKLFLYNVGEFALLHNIRSVAEDIVKECDGLPLAITAVARSMRWKMEKTLWQDALKALRGTSAAAEIRGMEHRVVRRLKLSFDNLKDNNTKMAFLLCSLFPKKYEILVDELVEYLIMEGLIDDVDNLVDATYKGYSIIERITDASLLNEEGLRDHKCVVRMHDMVRDMAIWITSNERPKFMVRAGLELKQPPQKEMWSSDIEKISLMKNEITELPFIPKCPKLNSLMLCENHHLTAIHSSFFESMNSLRLLDLSGTSIEALPDSLTSLVNLRALALRSCLKLREVPLLGKLQQLQFLDLSYSGIWRLPQDMGNLVELRKLNLSHLPELKTIPPSVISRLFRVEDLRIFRTYIDWAKQGEIEDVSKPTLADIGKLTYLATLKITISDIDCVAEDVFCSNWWNLRKFTMDIGEIHVKCSHLPCAKQVQIYSRDKYPRGVKEMLMHAEGLIMKWAGIKHVSHLVARSKSLRIVRIGECNEMDCVIDWREVGDNSLRNIEDLHLHKLPKLKKLFLGDVPRGSLWKLRILEVDECNKLKSLFSSEMVENLDQLEVLNVRDCDELEEIIEGNESLPENPLPRLCSLHLENLRQLRSIISLPTVAFPSLRNYTEVYCLKLKLPKCPNITKNKSEEGKLKEMEWEDENSSPLE